MVRDKLSGKSRRGCTATDRTQESAFNAMPDTDIDATTDSSSMGASQADKASDGDVELISDSVRAVYDSMNDESSKDEAPKDESFKDESSPQNMGLTGDKLRLLQDATITYNPDFPNNWQRTSATYGTVQTKCITMVMHTRPGIRDIMPDTMDHDGVVILKEDTRAKSDDYCWAGPSMVLRLPRCDAALWGNRVTFFNDSDSPMYLANMGVDCTRVCLGPGDYTIVRCIGACRKPHWQY